MAVNPIVSSVDPITFEILSHRLYQIAKEMGTALERVGGTVNTTQMHDYMASLYLANGDVLSAGDSMGWHVACAGFAVKRIIERFENNGGINPDDIFLLNDPYLAAIHQSDVYMISPIHFRGQLVGWSATFVHVMDIGAMSPGGNSPGATEICHEGIRIPGIKLVDRGELRKDLFDACVESILCTIAYDLPKNLGELKPIEVIATQGTVVNPTPPAPVSLNTTSGGATVKFVANSAIMQMLATSEKWRGEVMALNAGHRLARHAGVNQHGKYYVSTLSEGALDGTGARSYKDGDDTGRGLSCHNIEWLEANFPLLYLFRRNTRGGAGAGRYRGGTGGESALTVYDAPEGKIKGVALGVAGLRHSGQGMFGGYPGAPSLLMLTEGARVEETIAEDISPDQLAELGGTSKLLPYCEFDIGKNDVLYMRMSSGGGYGDPLEREPERVLSDVEAGIVSREEAQEIYGVVIDGAAPDIAATQKLRLGLKRERLRA